MSSKIGQSERIAAEMQFAPSPEDIAGRAAWIVNRYRLQPLDLPEGRFVGQIHSVNTQGLDTLTPLVYIAGLSKPVALSEADVQTLVRFSGKPFCQGLDWPHRCSWCGGRDHSRRRTQASSASVRPRGRGCVLEALFTRCASQTTCGVDHWAGRAVGAAGILHVDDGAGGHP
jgi:hypothetical protein